MELNNSLAGLSLNRVKRIEILKSDYVWLIELKFSLYTCFRINK